MPDEDDDLGRAATASSDAPGEPALVRSSTGFRVVEVGSTLGRYQLVEELGEGGMATVYRARDSELRRDVAIKVLFPHLAKRVDIVRRFDREARAAAGLEHENILRVYDVGGGDAPGGDPPYIVMELVRGQSLKEAVDAHGPLLAELCACAGALLADALVVAHAAGVIHRDIKPANVMVGPGGRLLLADFGVARVEDDDSLVTRTGALLGTPAFMSPEQATGGDVDARSDVYSLGATLYQLATGALPHTGPAARVVAAIASGELVPPVRRRPAIGVELSRQIERMMATEASSRPATAALAAEELRRMIAAAGLGDPADELAAYFADPPGYTAKKVPLVVGMLADRARAARAEGKLPRAMALIDRASALAPEDPAIQTLVGELSTRRPTKWLLAAGAGTLVLGLGAVVVYRTARTASIEPDAALDAASLAALSVDAAPASLAIADAATAITPAPADAATGTAATTPDARGASTRADARGAIAITRADAAAIAIAAPPDATPAPALADAAPAQHGSITVTMDSWCTLSIDGTGHGRADAKPRTIEVTPGDHDVSCTKEGVGATWQKKVHVDAGKTVAVKGRLLAEVTVTIGTRQAASIDGAKHAPGKQVPLTPGRHRVELGGKAFYIDVPRGTGCTLRDTDDPDRPADCFQ